MGRIAQRLDILKRDQLEFTPQGFLKMPVFAGRVGVQEYLDDEGNILREFRPPEEVFSERTMASLTMIPITNNHPRKMVDPDNARLLTVGFTGEHAEKVDDKFIKTTAVIFDKDTIEDVRLGKVEVSLGYDVELEETPGVFDGEKYDVIQRNIINNHLAIVDKGRGGPEVRLRLDSNCAVLKNENKIIIIKKEDSMAKVKIGDKEFELNDEVAGAVKDLIDQNEKLMKDKENEKEKEDQETEEEKKAAEAKKKEEEDQAAEEEKKKKEEEEDTSDPEKKNDRLQAKVDALEADNKKIKAGQMDAKQIDKIARQRTKVLAVGEQVLDSEAIAKMDDMDTVDIKKAIVEAESGTKMDGKSDDYIDARFDHISETVSKSDSANNKFSAAIMDKRQSENVIDAAETRKKNMKRDSELWMKPVGKSSEAKAN